MQRSLSRILTPVALSFRFFGVFFFFSFFALTLPEEPVKITSMNERDHHHLFPASQAGPIPLHNHYLVYASCQRQ